MISTLVGALLYLFVDFGEIVCILQFTHWRKKYYTHPDALFRGLGSRY